VSGISVNPERQAYYGDLHLHTSYSFDAYILFGAKVDPENAYRFGRGEAVNYLGDEVKRTTAPLDFLAVTDHSENIGVFQHVGGSKQFVVAERDWQGSARSGREDLWQDCGAPDRRQGLAGCRREGNH